MERFAAFAAERRRPLVRAAVLGVTPSTVNSRMARALARLAADPALTAPLPDREEP